MRRETVEALGASPPNRLRNDEFDMAFCSMKHMQEWRANEKPQFVAFDHPETEY